MAWDAASVAFSLFLFVLAGILEIGGGYSIWIALRENKMPIVFVPVGIIALIGYGFVPTLQPFDSFGRVFAVYGGFFIVLSYAWAHVFDGFVIDTGDIIGGLIALGGVTICWFWPRENA